MLPEDRIYTAISGGIPDRIPSLSNGFSSLLVVQRANNKKFE